MRTVLRLLTTLVLLCIGAQSFADEKADRAKLEKQFAEKLSGSKLVGYWTLWGKEAKPEPDSYALEKVTKLDGDNWRIEARIQFLKVDVKVPVTVQVKWAGDTPVLSVDKVGIPGVGTYSARVVFHGDHYAATWDGGDHGGHMYGKIVKDAKEPAKKKE
jgi:hypothetical protein